MTGNASDRFHRYCSTGRDNLPLRDRLRGDVTERFRKGGRTACLGLCFFACFFHEATESITFTILQAELSVIESSGAGIFDFMDDATDIGKRLKHLRTKVLDIQSQQEFADKLGGVTRGAVGNWELGKGVKRENLQRIADKFDISFEWLATGRGETPEMPDKHVQDAATPQFGAGIPNLKISAGMGQGGLEVIETNSAGVPAPGFTDGSWGLPAAVLTRLGPLRGIYGLPVQGDSMSPTIAGGSIAFVDTKHQYPSPPGIYAVDYGDGLLVKRVELIGGTDKISIGSDNPEYRNYEFAREDVKVWGRVIALWGWLD